MNAATTLRERSKALPAFTVFALLGTLALWLALSSLIPSVRAILSHASLVAFSPRDTIGLPLALLFFALAATTLLPKHEMKSRRLTKSLDRPDPGRQRGLTVCLGAAVTGVLLTVLAVPITELALSAIMTGRDYTPCPAPHHERRAPLRWSLPDGHCP